MGAGLLPALLACQSVSVKAAEPVADRVESVRLVEADRAAAGLAADPEEGALELEVLEQVRRALVEMDQTELRVQERRRRSVHLMKSSAIRSL